ncbi:hypothetical protein C791_0374 [Amycolatopsis azurea DSM 43854]|uniref:Uncharacterized protein n=1 Tax=Amycolatopsis azurea DSM 43854 TaxID=1238180 RepID=M2Q5W1_9PSEU|nr:hypothetical protein C791_0374 [Amycolatopsis azurea DSM 43854]
MRRVQRGRAGLAVLQRDGGRDAGGVLFGCGFVRGQGARLSRDQRALPWSPIDTRPRKFARLRATGAEAALRGNAAGWRARTSFLY